MSMPTSPAVPTKAEQRTTLLDALRGFALFGVVWSNYAYLSLWFFAAPEQRDALPGAALDGPLILFHDILIDGKFYSIFSLLFGIGFGFFLDKGTGGISRFVRRMLVLLVIGWVHLRYLWGGDILTLYALLGLLLPLFRRVADRTLLVLATLLVLSPIAADTANLLTGGAYDPVAPIERAIGADEAVHGPIPDAFLAAADGGWTEFQALAERGVLLRAWIIVDSNRIPKVLGLFLIGLWTARRKLFMDPHQHSKLLTRACVAGFALGLPFCTLTWYATNHLPSFPDPEGLVGTVAYALGVVPLAIAYAAGFALLWTQARWQQQLHVLAPMGRMALTNYLLQTVIGIALFYGVGLGWGTRVSVVGYEALALAVFITQVWWSKWWLQHFRNGLMEWLWRSLTYGKVMPMRKA